MAKKLLSVSSLAVGVLLAAGCTGNPGEPPPDAGVYDAPTDAPPRDGCDPSMNDATTAAGVLPPLPC